MRVSSIVVVNLAYRLSLCFGAIKHNEVVMDVDEQGNVEGEQSDATEGLGGPDGSLAAMRPVAADTMISADLLRAVEDETAESSVPEAFRRPLWTFSIPEAQTPGDVCRLSRTPLTLVWLLLLVVSWLHLFFHLGHRGSNFVLRVFCFIFKEKEQRLVAPDDEVLSLTTALTSLGLKDRFLVFPTCP